MKVVKNLRLKLGLECAIYSYLCKIDKMVLFLNDSGWCAATGEVGWPWSVVAWALVASRSALLLPLVASI
jgi:hypothetical protein